MIWIPAFCMDDESEMAQTYCVAEILLENTLCIRRREAAWSNPFNLLHSDGLNFLTAIQWPTDRFLL